MEIFFGSDIIMNAIKNTYFKGSKVHKINKNYIDNNYAIRCHVHWFLQCTKLKYLENKKNHDQKNGKRTTSVSCKKRKLSSKLLVNNCLWFDQDWLAEKDAILSSHLEHELTAQDLPDENQVIYNSTLKPESVFFNFLKYSKDVSFFCLLKRPWLFITFRNDGF